MELRASAIFLAEWWRYPSEHNTWPVASFDDREVVREYWAARPNAGGGEGDGARCSAQCGATGRARRTGSASSEHTVQGSGRGEESHTRRDAHNMRENHSGTSFNKLGVFDGARDAVRGTQRRNAQRAGKSFWDQFLLTGVRDAMYTIL